MCRKSIILLYCICFFLLISSSHPVIGEAKQQATIQEFTATSSKSHLILFAKLDHKFTPEMLEILHNGIPLEITFLVELDKITEQWPEEQITTFNFSHSIAYDTLKELYQVTLEEKNNRVYSFKEIDEAQQSFNEINGPKIVALKQLVPDNMYQLRIKAEFQLQTLPGSLQSVFPFLPRKDVETEWNWIKFTY